MSDFCQKTLLVFLQKGRSSTINIVVRTCACLLYLCSQVHITVPSSLTSCFILLDLCLLCFLFNFTSQLGTNVLSCCPHQFVYLFPQFVWVLCSGLPHSSCMCVSELCFSLVFSFLAPGCPIFCTVLGFSIDVAFFLTIFCLETNRQSVKSVKESWWLHS